MTADFHARRTINTKFILSLLGIGVIGTLTVWGLHRSQAGRSSRVFLEEAQRAERDQQYDRALQSYRSHIRLAPDSIIGRRGYGELSMLVGDPDSAIAQYERILTLDPSDQDVRRLAAEAALKVGRTDDAMAHITRLGSPDQDAELLEWIGRCRAAKRDFEGAAKSMQSAIDADPQRLSIYLPLASLMVRELDRPDRAESVIERMIDSNADSPEAHAVACRYHLARSADRLKAGDDAGAQESRRSAVAMADRLDALQVNEFDQLVLAARAFQSASNNAKAVEFSERAVAREPAIAAGHLLYSQTLMAADRPVQAIEALESGLGKVPPSEQTALQLSLAELYLDHGRESSAREIVAALVEVGEGGGRLDLLAARIDVLDKNWSAAASRLRAADLKAVGQPELHKRVFMLLGQVRQEAGDSRAAVDAFRQAATIDPDWSAPQAALVSALQDIGDTAAAYDALRQVVSSQAATPEAWLMLAQSTVNRELAQRPSERDWAGVEDVIARAEAKLPGDPRLSVLRAGVIQAKGDAKLASQLLRQSRDQAETPEARRLLLINQANLAIADQRFAEARDWLSNAQQEFPQDPTILLALADLDVRQDASRFADVRLRVLGQLASDSRDDRLGILASLTNLAVRAGDNKAAIEIVDQITNEFADRPDAWALAGSLAANQQDLTRVDRAAMKLNALEGESARWHQVEAQRLWLQAERVPEKLTARKAVELFGHLNAAKSLQPAWRAPYLFETDLLIALGRRSDAIKPITRAIELGVRETQAIRVAVSLLTDAGELQKADEMIQLLSDQQLATVPGLERTASLLSVGADDSRRALDLARRAATSSEDLSDHLWLGRLAASMAETDLATDAKADPQAARLNEEAESAFRRAIELDQQDSRAWLDLIRFLVSRGQADSANTAMEQFRDQISDPITLAQGWVALGRSDQAVESFESALTSENDANIDDLRMAIGVYLNARRIDLAEKRLGQLESRDDELTPALRRWTRRQRATMALAKGEPDGARVASQLISRNLQESPGETIDLRLSAVAAAADPSRTTTEELADLWQAVVATPAATASDQFEFARVLNRLDRWNQAAQQVRQAITNSQSIRQRRQFMSAYASWLLDRNETSDADLWLNQLQEIDDGLGVYAQLRARWHTSRSEHDEAVAVLERWVDTDPKDEPDGMALATKRLSVAQTARRISAVAPPEAREVYESMEEQQLRLATVQQPSARFVWAQSLHRRGLTDRGIKTLGNSKVTKQELNNAIAAADGIANAGPLTRRQIASLGRFTDELLRQFGDVPALLGLKASILKASGDKSQSIDVYRQMLNAEPDNVIALNNLAVVLGQSDRDQDREEARQLVGRAIKRAGQIPALLDTQATIAIAMADYQQAIALLSDAIRSIPGKSATFLFHRATANLRAGQRDAALEDLEAAMEAGLTASRLSAQEQSWLRELLETRQPS